MGTIVDRLLREYGFELQRAKKHKVYRRYDGKVFVQSKTPSDARSEQNSVADLCRMLGIRKVEAVKSLKRSRQLRSEPESVWIDDAPAPAPAPMAPTVPLPTQPSREDRRLAKRLERIDRNEAAKQDRFAAKWDEFMRTDAVLYVPTNEFAFLDNDMAVDKLHALLDDLDNDLMDSGTRSTIAKSILDGKEAQARSRDRPCG